MYDSHGGFSHHRHLSRVFFGGNGPIHWRTTCAQAYAGAIFCGRVLTRAFAGSLLSRNAFANALVFNFLKRELPHLHGHIFLFIGTSSFPFMGTSSPSMGTSSPSLAHLPLHGYIFVSRTRGGGALAGDGLLPRELSRGFRRDTRGTLSQKCPIRFMPHLHALNLRGETSKTDPRFAYADCLREDYREACARCLRVPTRTCKYQCFRFRGVNMSSPHKKVASFQKKPWLIWPWEFPFATFTTAPFSTRASLPGERFCPRQHGDAWRICFLTKTQMEDKLLNGFIHANIHSSVRTYQKTTNDMVISADVPIDVIASQYHSSRIQCTSSNWMTIKSMLA